MAGILAKLTPPVVIKLVDLPDLPDHSDAADFVTAQLETDTGELRGIIDAMADHAESIQDARSVGIIEHFEPFPIDALPGPVRGFVASGAKAIGCDLSYLALLMLTALAAAIGNTRRLRMKRGWDVRRPFGRRLWVRAGRRRRRPSDW